MNLRIRYMLLAAFLFMLAWFLFGKVPDAFDRTNSKTEVVPPSAAKLPESIGPHPLDPVIELAKREFEAFSQNVVDYTAVMLKRERIGGKLGEESQLAVKIINPHVTQTKARIPLHVYLRFESPNSVKGREVIWVDGKNDGNLIAHEAGMFNLMSVTLPPDGTLAMIGNKYPITGIGMGNLYKKLIEKGERDRRLGDCDVTIREMEPFDDRNVVLIEVKHPKKQADFDFHIARIYLDTDRHLPLRYESYLWPSEPNNEPPLEEQYTYQDIQLNVGLSESDFDPKNPDYQFP
jgi:Protein of unknown function (DUF1571)